MHSWKDKKRNLPLMVNIHSLQCSLVYLILPATLDKAKCYVILCVTGFSMTVFQRTICSNKDRKLKWKVKTEDNRSCFYLVFCDFIDYISQYFVRTFPDNLECYILINLHGIPQFDEKKRCCKIKYI